MKNFNELGKEVLNLLFKSRSGVYQDTSENRRKHRVGQHYGSDSTDDKKNGEEEAKEFISILKKNPSGANAERQLELMNDGELERFARFATACSRSNDLNSTTQKWCKQWADMARSNKTERGSDKSEQVKEKPVSGEKGSKREHRDGKESGSEVLLDEVLSSKNSVKEFEEYLAYLKDTNAPEAEISKVEADLAEKKKKAASAVEAYEKEKGKKPKSEVRIERLKKYQATLDKINEKLNDEGLSDESRKMGEELRSKMEKKIEKLEARIGGKKSNQPKKNNLKDAVDKVIENSKKKAESKKWYDESSIKEVVERSYPWGSGISIYQYGDGGDEIRLRGENNDSYGKITKISDSTYVGEARTDFGMVSKNFKTVEEAAEFVTRKHFNLPEKKVGSEESLKRAFKKGDIISGITEGNLKVRGKFVGFDEYKGKKYVRISGKEKNSNYLIPVENAVNETASERRAEKENKKAFNKEERIHTLKNNISNLRNKVQAIYDDPEVQDQTNVETGEIPSEYQSKIDEYEKKIDAYEKELKKLGGEEKSRSFSSYEEYMKGAL